MLEAFLNGAAVSHSNLQLRICNGSIVKRIIKENVFMMNKLIAWCFAVGIMLILNGCGGEDGGPNSDNGSNQPKNPEIVLSGSPETSVLQNQYYLFSPTVNVVSSKITYSITNKPAWAEFDSNTGTLRGAPGNRDIGITVDIVVSASNGFSSSSLPPFNLTVIDVNDPPVISSQPAELSADRYVYQVIAEDPDKNDVLIYSLTQAPTGMTISSTGLIEWQPIPGSYNVTVRVTDNGNLSAIQSFIITPASGKNQPFFSSVPTTDIKQNDTYTYLAKVTAMPGDVSFKIERGPRNMSVGIKTGLIEWIPTNQEIGQHPISIIAFNASGISIRQEFLLTVINRNDAPLVTSTPPTSAQADNPFQYKIVATDPDNDALAYELKRAPAGMLLSDNGQLNWIPKISDVGVHMITVVIVDSGTPALSTTHEFVLNVIDTANQSENSFIAITSIPNYVAVRDASYTYQVKAIGPGRLSYSLIFAPAGMTIDESGLIKWTPAKSESDSVVVKLSVKSVDSPASPVEQSFTITLPSQIPKIGWKILFADSQEAGSAPLAIDGNSATVWHTQFSRKQPLPPHEIQLDLGQQYDLSGFTYLPSQDLNTNGRVKEYEIYVSKDGINWGAPVAIGNFVNDSLEKVVLFPPTNGQFIRFVAFNDIKNTPFTSAAELGVLGVNLPSNSRPSASIIEPASDLEIAVGQSVNFVGKGMDSDTGQNLSYFWSFDNAAANSLIETPGQISFKREGTYSIWLTATDDSGYSDTTPERRIIKVTNGHTEIPKDRATIQFVDSEELTIDNGSAINAIDGNPTTNWISGASANTSSPLHEIQINLGSAFMVDGLRYLPRQDNTDPMRINDYRVYVSKNGVDWGSPISLGKFSNDGQEKHILFPPLWGQFVRLIALNEVTGGARISAAEIGFEGNCQKPYLKILNPTPNSLLSSGSLHVRTSICLEENKDWGVAFILDGNVVVEDRSAPFETTFSSLSRGNHNIEAFIIDGSGNRIAGENTYDKVENVAVGDYYVALGDSITTGVGDNDSSDNTSKDGRNNSGGFTPILSDKLSEVRNYPQLVVNEGIPGETAAGGLMRLHSVLKNHPESQVFLIMYGTNDSSGSTPPPSGLGLEPGQSGYAGSFKNTMQQIINSVIKNGKKPFLAKIPFGQVTNSRLSLIKEYNRVIDELVIANGISASPPDFFTYFEANQNELADKLHPNGIGYKQMANLWLNSIQ